jgi:hypothetical protein
MWFLMVSIYHGLSRLNVAPQCAAVQASCAPWPQNGRVYFRRLSIGVALVCFYSHAVLFQEAALGESQLSPGLIIIRQGLRLRHARLRQRLL